MFVLKTTKHKKNHFFSVKKNLILSEKFDYSLVLLVNSKNTNFTKKDLLQNVYALWHIPHNIWKMIIIKHFERNQHFVRDSWDKNVKICEYF